MVSHCTCHCSLFTVHCSLVMVHCLPFTVHCSLFTPPGARRAAANEIRPRKNGNGYVHFYLGPEFDEQAGAAAWG
eukprot:6657650-Lingulodinium_polyedra.AAC.1